MGLLDELLYQGATSQETDQLITPEGQVNYPTARFAQPKQRKLAGPRPQLQTLGELTALTSRLKGLPPEIIQTLISRLTGLPDPRQTARQDTLRNALAQIQLRYELEAPERAETRTIKREAVGERRAARGQQAQMQEQILDLRRQAVESQTAGMIDRLSQASERVRVQNPTMAQAIDAQILRLLLSSGNIKVTRD